MEPIVHILIPLVFLLAIFYKLDKKYVFYLLPLTFIIDLDTYIPGTHRYLFHNLLFVILISTIVYFAWDKRAYFVSLFYLGSHLILDFAEPGVALLYPLVQKTYYLVAEITYYSGWDLNLWFGSMSITELPTDYVAYYFTTYAALFLILLGVLLVAKYGKDLKKFFKDWHCFLSIYFALKLFHNITH